MGDGASTVFGGTKNGSFGFARMRDAAGADSISFDDMTVAPSELVGEVQTVVNGTATRTFNNAQPTLLLHGPATSISSQLLLGLFDPALFNTQRRMMTVFPSYATQGTTTGWPAVSCTCNLGSSTLPLLPSRLWA